jgi:hypothetical protein
MRPFSDDVEEKLLARTGFRRGEDGRDVKNGMTSFEIIIDFLLAWPWACAWAWAFAWTFPLHFMFMHRVKISRAQAEVRVLRAGVGGALGEAAARVSRAQA